MKNKKPKPALYFCNLSKKERKGKTPEEIQELRKKKHEEKK